MANFESRQQAELNLSYTQIKAPVEGTVGYEFGNLVNGIDVRAEAKRASNIEFQNAASPEVLYLPQRPRQHLLVNAEQHLSSGDSAGA